MITNKDLEGAIVIARPEVWDKLRDAAHFSGEIMHADIITDDFYVTHRDGEISHLSADALLVLKSPDKIYELLELHPEEVSATDFKDLVAIALLLEHGTPKHIGVATGILQKNTAILKPTTTPLDEMINPSVRKMRSR